MTILYKTLKGGIYSAECVGKLEFPEPIFIFSVYYEGDEIDALELNIYEQHCLSVNSFLFELQPHMFKNRVLDFNLPTPVFLNQVFNVERERIPLEIDWKGNDSGNYTFVSSKVDVGIVEGLDFVPYSAGQTLVQIMKDGQEVSSALFIVN